MDVDASNAARAAVRRVVFRTAFHTISLNALCMLKILHCIMFFIYNMQCIYVHGLMCVAFFLNVDIFLALKVLYAYLLNVCSYRSRRETSRHSRDAARVISRRARDGGDGRARARATRASRRALLSCVSVDVGVRVVGVRRCVGRARAAVVWDIRARGACERRSSARRDDERERARRGCVLVFSRIVRTFDEDVTEARVDVAWGDFNSGGGGHRRRA